MDFIAILISSITSYLIGGIPTSYLVAEYRGIRSPSHQMSFTISDSAAIFIIDVIKGALPVYICLHLLSYPFTAVLTAGIAVVLGHIYTPYLRKFRGGKGIAVAIGTSAVIYPPSILFLLPFFSLILLISRYTVIAAFITYLLLTPFYLLISSITVDEAEPELIAYFSIISLIILLGQKNNLRRLRTGREPKFSFRKKEERTMGRQYRRK